ncbi:heme ABC exporter ATP-binding protein CcmA [Sandaracinobacteroides saxicola]|uniref:Heme ABC exporter ATP-binding protein CcmA n=1 Tax=Sandaracinobacteroides saxicola TaxID=2759707 RepID=A0A7G5IHR8_9SPHN|nr:heme ABC exporter ATP-binding protein CcmA [Sandaracinobacteroides saxicola]QMW22910.1 heme ABC exporter ATP-binding protein CcmA [Sandaracinobacteroides saxicola]
MSVLDVTTLACVRSGRLLFENLSFTVPRGGALIVTGPNGAGKSSLLRLLAGLLEPAAGTIHRPDRLAYLGHDSALKPDRTLAGELAFWAALDGADTATRNSAASAMALDGLLDLPVRLLSAGQKRRAALARTLAAGATLWLLDEPTVGLDAAACERLATAIAGHRERGGAVVAATHVDLGLAHAATLPLGVGHG